MSRVLTPTEAKLMFAAIDEARTNQEWHGVAQSDPKPGSNGHAAPKPADEVVGVAEVIDQVLVELRDIEAQLADLVQRKGALREVLASQIGFARGESVVRPLATVKVAPGSERVSYDRRAVDAIAASDATIAGILAPHRKVTVVPPTLRITWRKDGWS